MNSYQTRDLIAVGRPLAYDGQEHQPGARFRPISQIDADYLVSRGRAKVAPDETPPPDAPQSAAADQVAATPRRRGRPTNAERAAAAAATAAEPQSEEQAPEPSADAEPETPAGDA